MRVLLMTFFFLGISAVAVAGVVYLSAGHGGGDSGAESSDGGEVRVYTHEALSGDENIFFGRTPPPENRGPADDDKDESTPAETGEDGGGSNGNEGEDPAPDLPAEYWIKVENTEIVGEEAGEYLVQYFRVEGETNLPDGILLGWRLYLNVPTGCLGWEIDTSHLQESTRTREFAPLRAEIKEGRFLIETLRKVYPVAAPLYSAEYKIVVEFSIYDQPKRMPERFEDFSVETTVENGDPRNLVRDDGCLKREYYLRGMELYGFLKRFYDWATSEETHKLGKQVRENLFREEWDEQFGTFFLNFERLPVYAGVGWFGRAREFVEAARAVMPKLIREMLKIDYPPGGEFELGVPAEEYFRNAVLLRIKERLDEIRQPVPEDFNEALEMLASMERTMAEALEELLAGEPVSMSAGEVAETFLGFLTCGLAEFKPAAVLIQMIGQEFGEFFKVARTGGTSAVDGAREHYGVARQLFAELRVEIDRILGSESEEDSGK